MGHQAYIAQLASPGGLAYKRLSRSRTWLSGAHVDLQITSADWNATPRRDLLAPGLFILTLFSHTTLIQT
jgi:hypothetical protein